MAKSINVLIDLPGIGILDLPIIYTTNRDKKKPNVSLIKGSVLLTKENVPKWLGSPDFIFVYAKGSIGMWAVASISNSLQVNNRYREIALSVVANYIKIQEEKDSYFGIYH